ncbi:5-formyltetrahydrofolate cyclo-ligase [Sulfuriferula thiophila]|uniref:5-formyltetrahydrofolate cyclo-ligase n=1 Tax=Sulfuriferula thiophila TaxID=1781211 RepID=UPI000F6121E5|nr:5-formyltetrahydrofolate cyclo-ligase [Sulfuriferula thiophila]
MNKSQLRSQLQRRRRAVTPPQRVQAARQLVRHALRAGLLQRYQHVGLYLPHGAEINTMPLLNRVLSLGKHTYLPMLPFGRGKKLWFNRLEAGNRWIYNRFGIPETHGKKSVRAQQLDVVFMPLVGYDDFGYRIGMGGGYYDASLEFLLRRCRWRRPYLIGVAFSCQHVPGKLPHDPWDIPLNAILTEQGLHRFGRN